MHASAEASAETSRRHSSETQEGRLAADTQGLTLFTEAGHIRRLRDIESDILAIAMRHYGGRRVQMARALRIGRSTLYRKLADFNIE